VHFAFAIEGPLRHRRTFAIEGTLRSKCPSFRHRGAFLLSKGLSLCHRRACFLQSAQFAFVIEGLFPAKGLLLQSALGLAIEGLFP
jgi:hypothetical protein